MQGPGQRWGEQSGQDMGERVRHAAAMPRVVRVADITSRSQHAGSPELLLGVRVISAEATQLRPVLWPWGCGQALWI